MLRGENEGFLKLRIRPPQEKALSFLHRRFVKGTGAASAQVVLAVEDSYPRLLAPSIETDIRQQAKGRADDEALRVFARNPNLCYITSIISDTRKGGWVLPDLKSGYEYAKERYLETIL